MVSSTNWMSFDETTSLSVSFEGSTLSSSVVFSVLWISDSSSSFSDNVDSIDDSEGADGGGGGVYPINESMPTFDDEEDGGGEFVSGKI